ncbi:MAG: membrane integrity-associated transporter subunit PqiC [Legionellales bacterium]|nr:membrane integrity-associated transporter subunit PqiC [Legionellales bacterium]
MRKVILLSLFLFSGCSLGPVKVKPIDYYTLESVKIRESYTNQEVLSIDTPSAVRGLQTNAMLYSERDFQIGQYAYSKWEAAPANLLQDLLLESFNKAGVFKAVVDSSFAKTANWKLSIRILQWHQIFLESPSEIWVSYIANIYDIKKNKIIASKLFEAKVPCATDDAYGGVVAMNQAMKKLIPKTISFVKIYTR